MVRSVWCLGTAYPFLLIFHYSLRRPKPKSDYCRFANPATSAGYRLIWRSFPKIANLGRCSLMPRLFVLTQGNVMSPFVCCRSRPCFIGLTLLTASLIALAVVSPQRQARAEAGYNGVEAAHGMVVSVSASGSDVGLEIPKKGGNA